MSDISDDFQFAPDASEADINALVAALRKKIPHDYPREIPHNYYLFLSPTTGARASSAITISSSGAPPISCAITKRMK